MLFKARIAPGSVRKRVFCQGLFVNYMAEYNVITMFIPLCLDGVFQVNNAKQTLPAGAVGTAGQIPAASQKKKLRKPGLHPTCGVCVAGLFSRFDQRPVRAALFLRGRLLCFSDARAVKQALQLSGVFYKILRFLPLGHPVKVIRDQPAQGFGQRKRGCPADHAA